MRLLLLYIGLIVLGFSSVYSQMPDWFFFKDRDGNTYFIDVNNKIYTTGKPQKRFITVSAHGLDYYLNHAIEIVKFHPVEGLTLLKSILVLPEKNLRIRDARSKASHVINDIQKNNGDRYYQWDRDASLLLVKHNNITSIIDDEMRFSVKIPYDVTVINHIERLHVRYKYSGVSAGIKIQTNISPDNNKFRCYDMLIAIDAESFPGEIHDLNQLEENWRNNLGSDNLQRKMLSNNNHRKIYEISHKEKPIISGQEAFFLNHKIGYILRIICPDEIYNTYRKEIDDIVISFNSF